MLAPVAVTAGHGIFAALFPRRYVEQFAKVEIPLPEDLWIGNKRLSVR